MRGDGTVTRHHDPGAQRTHRVENPKKLARDADDHHATPSSTRMSPAKSTRCFGSQTIRSPGECPAPGWAMTIGLPQPQGIGAGHRPVGGVGKLEPAHGVESDHPDPIRDQRVLASLRSQSALVRTRDHARAGFPQYHRAEVMVRMVMGQYQPSDRPVGDPADGAEEPLALPRARQRVDHDHPVGGHDETGVGPSLDAAARVAGNRVHVGRQHAQGQRVAGNGESERDERCDQRKRGADQAETNRRRRTG